LFAARLVDLCGADHLGTIENQGDHQMTSKTTRRALLAGAAATGALAALPARAGRDVKDGKIYKIEIKDFKFSPARLTVKPGDKIRWINRDRAPHDATALDRSWKTKVLRKNGKDDITVTEGMVTIYYCSVHPQMRAKFVIDTA
jgi:plastocyanin